MKRRLFILAAALLAVACTEHPQDAPPARPPVVTLDNETSIYTTKVGRPIEICPAYENADNAAFVWSLEGEVIGTERTLRFASEQPGSYYISITATNSDGQDRKELRVDVLTLDPPVITLPGAAEGFSVLLGSELELQPHVTSSLETAYRWTVDGREVSAKRHYTFPATQTGDYAVRFAASNADGDDAVEFSISVRSAEEMDFAWTFEQTEYNVSEGRTICIRALEVKNAFNARYTWIVDGVTAAQSDKPVYAYNATGQGAHTVKLEMQNEYLLATQTFIVNVCPKEGAYYRPKTAASAAACNKVYAFLAAPGQFVNENYSAATMEQACAYAQERMARNAYVSLGGFGGYIVVGFDHSVNNDGGYDIAVTGNAFDGSSEPGIVWVMQDENGDGLPNDTWYELRGSEYGKQETIQDYAVTYFRPAAPEADVTWTDNRGGSGAIQYLGAFHKQDFYYPAWVETDSYTLRGTCLKSRSYDASGDGSYWVNPAFEWGYADNFSPIDRLADGDNYNASQSDNHFKISNAVTFDGRAADLKYIDFVKIQVGLNVQCGRIGEVSSEVFGIKDFNMTR